MKFDDPGDSEISRGVSGRDLVGVGAVKSVECSGSCSGCVICIDSEISSGFLISSFS